MMSEKKTIEPILFPIGETCNMCNVTPRTLHYYEKIGLIKPDQVREGSGYRYYSLKTMERIQVIRWYHEEGFSLERIAEMLQDSNYTSYMEAYRQQIEETEAEIEKIQRKLYHLKSSQAILLEADEVISHRYGDVHVRYIQPTSCLQYTFTEEGGKDPLRLHNDGYLRFLDEGLGALSMVDLSGGYSVLFPSIESRIKGRPQKITLLQPVQPLQIPSGACVKTMTFGGFNAVCAYHLGTWDGLTKTYEKLNEWSEEHGYEPEGNALERPLWWDFSPKDDEIIMEIALPIKGDCEQTILLRKLREETGGL